MINRLFVLLIVFGFVLYVFSSSVMAISQSQLNSLLNNTPFYDPSENCSATISAGGNTANLSGQNIEQIFQFFAQNGYTSFQAAAIAGNISQESGGNPQIYQADGSNYLTPPGNEGWGIVQWTPPAIILQYAASNNLPAYSLVTQLQLVLQELSTNNATVGKDIKSTIDISQAVAAFEGNLQYGGQYVGFERPAHELADFMGRYVAAQQIFKRVWWPTYCEPWFW